MPYLILTRNHINGPGKSSWFLTRKVSFNIILLEIGSPFICVQETIVRLKLNIEKCLKTYQIYSISSSVSLEGSSYRDSTVGAPDRAKK